MDRKLILSVAGSGKTKLLIDRLDEERRFLIVTYTDKNSDNIKRRTLRKFGYIPKNVTIYTFFEFLLAVCYRPFFSYKVKAKGIDWKMPDTKTRYYKRTNKAFYINTYHRIYHNRISLLCNTIADEIKNRIEKYYDCFYYDEAQDLNGHDFNLILRIIPESIETLIVGDFFQHTFSTSTDGNTNHGLYDDILKYKNKWLAANYKIDETTLIKSHRCSPVICDFVRTKIGIDIYSANNNNSVIKEINDSKEAEILIQNNHIPKLFLKDAHKYTCYTLNWGESKGLDDFEDVCVVLNKTTLDYFYSNRLYSLPSLTKNKLYVACTRASRNIYFLPFTFLEKYKKGII